MFLWTDVHDGHAILFAMEWTNQCKCFQECVILCWSSTVDILSVYIDTRSK